MGLKDKASKINFAALGGTVPSPATETKAAKTAPGELMAFANQQRSQLLQENEALKAQAAQAEALQRSLDETVSELRQWDGAKAARLLDPELIVRSRWANRHELNFSGPEFEALRAEIRSAGGNIQPIKVRPLGDGRFEIVFGHRRHEACRLEGKPVLAMIDNLDDRAMFVEMDRENRARKNLSPYEQGLMYRNALNNKLFPNQKTLAHDTGADPSLVTKALYLADLPADVVAAFPSLLDIQFRYARPLAQALASHGKAVLTEARRIAQTSPRPEAKVVFERLMGAAAEKMEPFHFPAPVAFEVAGRKVGSLTVGRNGVALQLSHGVLQEQDIQALRQWVERLLSRSAD
ncbi:MAG: ParB/RepB/Spo0J family partition protein [Aquabacterium sp.]